MSKILAAVLLCAIPLQQSHPAHPKPRPATSTPPVSSDSLFSLRARRRFAAYLRMRLLEMREAGLARAADAIERQLPVDTLVAPNR